MAVSTLLAAFGLMLVFEGLIPLLAPKTWRKTVKRMIVLQDGQLRFIGLVTLTGGFLLLFLFNH